MELTEQELSNEAWKDIKGYEGLYQVSNNLSLVRLQEGSNKE